MICDGWRTDTVACGFDNAAMPRYSFTLEDRVRVADPNATENLADNQAAMDLAKQIAKDFARSLAAQRGFRIVVRDDAGKQVGNVPVLADRR
jgi:hypothetical protein